MDTVLTAPQRAVVDLMRAGWELGYTPGMLTGANPIVADPIIGVGGKPVPGFVGIRVADSAAAWVAWWDAIFDAEPDATDASELVAARFARRAHEAAGQG